MILFIEHETWPFLSWPMRQKHFQWARYDLLFKIYYIELALLSVFVRGRRHSYDVFNRFPPLNPLRRYGAKYINCDSFGLRRFYSSLHLSKTLVRAITSLHCRVHNFCVQITLSVFFNNLFFFFFLENSRVYCFIYTNKESYYISVIVIKIYFSIFAKKETKIFRFFLLFFYIYYESILRM